MPQRRVVIIGNYGATNAGDEAVLSGLLTLARSKLPDAAVTVLSYDPALTRAEHGCHALPLLPFGFRSFRRFNWGASFAALRRADEVWIGGGALFTDERLFAIFLWGYHALCSRLLCGHVYMVANTVGPIRTLPGRVLMRLILPWYAAASVRDAESAQVLHRLGWCRSVTVAADPAYLIAPAAPAPRKKHIVVSLRPWHALPPGLFPALSTYLNRKLSAGYQVTLLPMQVRHDDDRIPLRQLYGLLGPSRALDLRETLPPLPEILSLLSTAELVIGMRLHSLILAAIQATPFVALSYSDKVDHFCRSVGASAACLPLPAVDAPTLAQCAEALLDDQKARSDALAEAVAALRTRAQQAR